MLFSFCYPWYLRVQLCPYVSCFSLLIVQLSVRNTLRYRRSTAKLTMKLSWTVRMDQKYGMCYSIIPKLSFILPYHLLGNSHRSFHLVASLPFLHPVSVVHSMKTSLPMSLHYFDLFCSNYCRHWFLYSLYSLLFLCIGQFYPVVFVSRINQKRSL